MRILLVEDEAEYARVVEGFLRFSDDGTDWSFEHAGSLHEALEVLAAHPIDCIVLDLGLPDTDDLSGLTAIVAQHPTTPVVVLTSRTSRDLTDEAFRIGAQDYLVKGRSVEKALSGVLRRAIERHSHFLSQLRAVEEEARIAREAAALARLSAVRVPTASRAFDAAPLRERQPFAFDDLTERYRAAIEVALEEQAYQGSPSASSALRRIAGEMAGVSATPRDVIEVHSRAIETLFGEANPMRRTAYLSEGRVVLLELMGYLASQYRSRSTAPGPANGTAEVLA